MGKIRFLTITFIFLFLLSCTSHKAYRAQIKPIEPSNEAYSIYYYLKFLDFIKSKKLDEARSAIEKAISYKSDPQLYVEYARLLITQNKIKRAEDILKQGLQKNPANKNLIFFLSDVYLHEKKYFNAYELLKTYLKERQGDVEAVKKIATILLNEKKFDVAIRYLNSVDEKKKDEIIYFLLAKCYDGLLDRKKSIESLKKAVEKKPDFVRAWAELAYQYELENDLVSAEKVYSKLLSSGILNKELVLRLMEINIKLGKYQRAYEVANSYFSEPVEILSGVSLFLQQEIYGEAENLLKTIENFEEEYPQITYYKAVIKFKKYNDIKGALLELNKIDEHSKIYKNVFDLKMKLMLLNKDYKGLEALLKKEIAKNSKKIELYLYLSEVYLLNKKYNDAVSTLNECLKIDPDNVEVLFQLGTIYYKQEKKDLALKIMEKILAINPKYASALNFIGYTLIDEDKDLEKGFKLVSKAIELEPKNGYFIDSLAWYYYKIKDYKNAWKYINNAIKYVNDDPTIWEHCGDIAIKLNKIDEAKKAYKNALKNNHENPDKIKTKLMKLTNN